MTSRPNLNDASSWGTMPSTPRAGDMVQMVDDINRVERTPAARIIRSFERLEQLVATEFYRALYRALFSGQPYV